MNIKKAVVTGATGMIGSELIRQMVEDKILVYAVVRPNSRKMSNLPKSELVQAVECDVSNYLKLPDLIPDADIFYHFAWSGCYGESRNNLLLQEKNVQASIEAVKVAKSIGCQKFVGAGSQAEFGSVEGKLSDSLPKNPITGYGIAKHSAQLMTKAYCEQIGIDYNWACILSCYGPGDNDYTMIMSAIKSMLNGEHIAFTPGEQIWDYVYVEDCARAFYLIGENGLDGKIYTIGSGKAKMLKEYIYDIRDAIDPSLELGVGERDYYPNQVMHLEADITELTNDVGYKPKVNFEMGIRKTIDWRKSRV